MAIACGVVGYTLLQPAPEEIFTRAMSLAETRQLEAAKRLTQRLESHPGFSAEVSLLRGLILLRSDQPREALPFLRRSIDSMKLRPLAYRYAGECYIRDNQAAEGERLLRESLIIEPIQPDAHRWLATSYYDRGAMEHAYRHLEIVAELDPFDGRPHWLMGVIHFEFAYYPQAIEAFTESLRRDPSPPYYQELVSDLAIACLREKEFKLALSYLNKLPATPAVRAAHAECQFEMGNVKDAERITEQLLKEHPNHPTAKLLAAKIHIESNEHQAAADKLTTILKRNPVHSEAHYLMAQVMNVLGNRQAAEQHMQQFQKISQLKDRFTKLNEEAILKPNDATVRLQLSEIAQQLGEEKLAEIWLKAAKACE